MIRGFSPPFIHVYDITSGRNNSLKLIADRPVVHVMFRAESVILDYRATVEIGILDFELGFILLPYSGKGMMISNDQIAASTKNSCGLVTNRF